MRTLIAIAVVLSLATPAAADDGRVAYSELGLDGAATASLGLGVDVPRAGPRLALAWWFDVTWVAGRLDGADNRVRGGVRVDALRSGRWYLRASLAAARRATSNTGFDAQAFTTELELAPGVDAGRWSFQLEASIEQTWIAHIAPTATYRELIYPSARSGWYGMTGRTLRAGPAIGVRLGRVELTARGGLARAGALDALPSIHAAIGVGYRF